MNLLDIHTHHIPSVSAQAIFSASLKELPETMLKAERKELVYYSAGIHPWHIETNYETAWKKLQEASTQKAMVAIGEAGLDKLSPTPLSLQKKAFEQQIELAEAVNKPLIIHSVHTFNEIIQLKKSFHPSVAWIIHGFRGKKEMAEQLLDHGLYLSFGAYYAEEALRITPCDKLFLETDESLLSITSLYEKAAQLLSLPVCQLTLLVQNNMCKVFPLQQQPNS